jgi:ribosomal protein S21
MAKKAAHVSVHIKETRGNVEKLIRKFIKKAKKVKVVEQVRNRQYYKKPSVKKEEKRRRAGRARQREQQKRLKAQQRRDRRK